MLVKTAALCFLCLVCGCHDNTKDWPWGQYPSATAAGIPYCPEGKVQCSDSNLEKVAAYCEHIREAYAEGANKSNVTQLITAVSGTLAGAVVAPIAKGSGKDAASGFAGSTNAMQKQIGDAFNTATALSESSAVYFAFASSYRDYQSATTESGRQRELVRMAMRCAVAPNIATSDAMKALLSGGMPTDWPSSSSSAAQLAKAATVAKPAEPATIPQKGYPDRKALDLLLK